MTNPLDQQIDEVTVLRTKIANITMDKHLSPLQRIEALYALIRDQQTALLEGVLAEWPEEETSPSAHRSAMNIGEYTTDIHANGFNEALDKTRAIITAALERVSG